MGFAAGSGINSGAPMNNPPAPFIPLEDCRTHRGFRAQSGAQGGPGADASGAVEGIDEAVGRVRGPAPRGQRRLDLLRDVPTNAFYRKVETYILLVKPKLLNLNVF